MSNKGLNKDTISNQMGKRTSRRKGERWRAKAKRHEGTFISNGMIRTWSGGNGGNGGGWNIIDKYLKSKVGQRWDDVYSELVKNGRMDGFRDRIHKSIEYNPQIIEGVAYYSRWGKYVKVNGPYVDNEGIVRYQTVKRDKWKPKNVPYITIGGTRYIYTETKYFWLDGGWCEVSKHYGNVDSPIIMEYKTVEKVKIDKLKLDDMGKPIFYNHENVWTWNYIHPAKPHIPGRPIIDSIIINKIKYIYIPLSLHTVMSDPSLKQFYLDNKLI